MILTTLVIVFQSLGCTELHQLNLPFLPWNVYTLETMVVIGFMHSKCLNKDVMWLLLRLVRMLVMFMVLA